MKKKHKSSVPNRQSVTSTSKLNPIHPNAAGIDIGSQHHCVCCACLEDGLTSRLYRSWQDYYEQLYRERMVNNLHKKAQAFGFELIPLHSGNLVS